MSGIFNLQEKYFFYLLNKQVKKVRRNKAFHTFDTAKSVGVIFDASLQEKYFQAKTFISYLNSKNIEVSALAFVKNKESANYFQYHSGVKFIAVKDVKLYKNEQINEIDEFINRPFDMLIDLVLEETLYIKYLLAMSKAHFKISKNSNLKFSDFVVNLNGQFSLEKYIDSLKLYLNSISIQPVLSV